MSARHRLLGNMASLGLLQGANYLFPLLTLPYLVRVLGPEQFGLVAFAQAVAAYFTILTDYGFNWSATREASVSRDDPARLSRLFSSVMTIRALLLLVGLLVLGVATAIVPRLQDDSRAYFAAYTTVVGGAMLPVWLFQGLERMGFITAANLATKAVSTLLIFLVVRRPEHHVLVLALQGAGSIVGGVVGLAVVRRACPGLRLVRPTLASLREALVDGWHVFLSTAAVNIYTSSTLVFLGFVAGNQVVGFYSAADRLVRALVGLMGPVSQSLYPHISALAARSREEALAFLRRTTRWIGSAALVTSLAILVGAGLLVRVALGPGYEESVVVLRWLAPLPFVIALSNLLGVQTMLTLGLKREFSRTLLLSGLFNVVLFFPLAHRLGAAGAAVATLLTEAFVATSMQLVLQRRGLNLFRSVRALA